MNLQEYLKVKEYTYNEYCVYLLSKYGPVPCVYMTPLFTKDPKSSRINSRTAEGLVIHHIKEDRAILLSSPHAASLCPYEFQKKENLVYCDYLEHLLLHVLIHKYPYNPGDTFVGVGGMYSCIIPEINELYDGTNFTPWKRGCYKRIKDDKNAYFKILDQLYELEKSIDPDEEDRSVLARFECWGMRSNTL